MADESTYSPFSNEAGSFLEEEETPVIDWTNQVQESFKFCGLTTEHVFMKLQNDEGKDINRPIRSKEFFQNLNIGFGIDVPFSDRREVFSNFDLNKDGYLDFLTDFCKCDLIEDRNVSALGSIGRSRSAAGRERSTVLLIARAIHIDKLRLRDIWNGKENISVAEFIKTLQAKVSKSIDQLGIYPLLYSMDIDPVKDRMVNVVCFKNFLEPKYTALLEAGELDRIKTQTVTFKSINKTPRKIFRPTTAKSIIAMKESFSGYMFGKLEDKSCVVLILDLSPNGFRKITVDGAEFSRIAFVVSEMVAFIKDAVRRRSKSSVNIIGFGHVTGIVKWQQRAVTIDEQVGTRAILYLHKLMTQASSNTKVLDSKTSSKVYGIAIANTLKQESSPVIITLCPLDKLTGGLINTKSKPIIKQMKKMMAKDLRKLTLSKPTLNFCVFGTLQDNHFSLCGKLSRFSNGFHTSFMDNGQVEEVTSDSVKVSNQKPRPASAHISRSKTDHPDLTFGFWWKYLDSDASAKKIYKAVSTLCAAISQLNVPLDESFDAFDRNLDRRISISEFMLVFRDMMKTSRSKIRLSRLEEYKLWRCLDATEAGEIDVAAYCGFFMGAFQVLKIPCPEIQDSKVDANARKHLNALNKRDKNPAEVASPLKKLALIADTLCTYETADELLQTDLFVFEKNPPKETIGSSSSEEEEEDEFEEEDADEFQQGVQPVVDHDDMDWLPPPTTENNQPVGFKTKNVETKDDEYTEDSEYEDEDEFNATEVDDTVKEIVAKSPDSSRRLAPCPQLVQLGFDSIFKLGPFDVNWATFCASYNESPTQQGLDFSIHSHGRSFSHSCTIAAVVQESARYTSLSNCWAISNPMTPSTRDNVSFSLHLKSSPGWSESTNQDLSSVSLQRFATCHPLLMNEWLVKHSMWNVLVSAPFLSPEFICGSSSDLNRWSTGKKLGPLASGQLRSILKLTPLLNKTLSLIADGEVKVVAVTTLPPEQNDNRMYREAIEMDNGEVVDVSKLRRRISVKLESYCSNGKELMPPGTHLPLKKYFGDLSCYSCAKIETVIRFPSNLNCSRYELGLPGYMPFASDIDTEEGSIRVGIRGNTWQVGWDQPVCNNTVTYEGIRLSCTNAGSTNASLSAYSLAHENVNITRGYEELYRSFFENDTKVVCISGSNSNALWLVECDPQWITSSLSNVASSVLHSCKSSGKVSTRSRQLHVSLPEIHFESGLVPCESIEKTKTTMSLSINLDGCVLKSTTVSSFELKTEVCSSESFQGGNIVHASGEMSPDSLLVLEQDHIVFSRPFICFSTQHEVVTCAFLVGRDAWVGREPASKEVVAVHSSIPSSPTKRLMKDATPTRNTKVSINASTIDICQLIEDTLTVGRRDPVENLLNEFFETTRAIGKSNAAGISKRQLYSAMRQRLGLEISMQQFESFFRHVNGDKEFISKSKFLKLFSGSVNKRVVKTTHVPDKQNLTWIRDALFDIAEALHSFDELPQVVFKNGASIAEFVKLLQALDLGLDKVQLYQLVGLVENQRRLSRQEFCSFIAIIYSEFLKDLRIYRENCDDRKTLIGIEAQIEYYSKSLQEILLDVFRTKVSNAFPIDKQYVSQVHLTTILNSELEENFKQLRLVTPKSRRERDKLKLKIKELQDRAEKVSRALTTLSNKVGRAYGDHTDLAIMEGTFPWIQLSELGINSAGPFKLLLEQALMLDSSSGESSTRQSLLAKRVEKNLFKWVPVEATPVKETPTMMSRSKLHVHWGQTLAVVPRMAAIQETVKAPPRDPIPPVHSSSVNNDSFLSSRTCMLDDNGAHSSVCESIPTTQSKCVFESTSTTEQVGTEVDTSICESAVTTSICESAMKTSICESAMNTSVCESVGGSNTDIGDEVSTVSGPELPSIISSPTVSDNISDDDGFNSPSEQQEEYNFSEDDDDLNSRTEKQEEYNFSEDDDFERYSD